MASNASLRWIPGLIPGDASSHIAVELAVYADARTAKASPFVMLADVMLADAGRFSQVVLARIALPDGSTLVPLALKLPRTSVREKGSRFLGATVNNPEIDAIWAREREVLTAADGDGLVPLCDLLGEAVLPAMTYCRRREQLFTVPSPQSWGPLELCREDSILREHGLEPYSTSTVRYLYSPAQLAAGGGEAPTFYTWSSDAGADARSSCRVRRRAELYRDLARIKTAALSAAQREDLTASVPCLTCEHAEACCGAVGGEADGALPIEAELSPLTVAPSPVRFSRLLPYSFADWCDLLGGADARHGLLASKTALYAVPESAAPETKPGTGLFDLGRAAEYATEALCLKLIAFEQVCTAVAQFHKTSKRPLFGLSAQSFRVESTAPGLGLPSKWSFAVQLDDSSAQHRFALPASQSSVPDLFVPTADAAAAGVSPFADAATFSQELSMGMTVQAVETCDDHLVLTIDTLAQGVRIAAVRPGDVAVIEPNSELPELGDGTLLATVLRAQPGGAQLQVELLPGVRFPVDGLPLALGALVTFYRRLHVPCDLHGLGMLLARALLVNDAVDAFGVEDELATVHEKLRLAIAGVEEPDRSYVTTTVGHLYETGVGGFDFDRLLYRATDREACRASSVEPAVAKVWSDALVLIMRLIGQFAEFSYGSEHDAYDPLQPEALALRVRADVHALVRRLRVEMFGQKARGREISGLCDGLLTEINKELYGKEGA